MAVSDPVPAQDEENWSEITESGSLPAEEPMRGLVAAPDSLTRRLRELCGPSFRLRLVGEQRGPIDGTGRDGLVREVLMSCGEVPWVFAQTFIPETTLDAHCWLLDLGERPLGDALFRHGGVQRGEFRCRHVSAPDPLHQRALGVAGLAADTPPGALWVRRRGYALDGLGLLIREVFLPECGRCQTS